MSWFFFKILIIVAAINESLTLESKFEIIPEHNICPRGFIFIDQLTLKCLTRGPISTYVVPCDETPSQNWYQHYQYISHWMLQPTLEFEPVLHMTCISTLTVFNSALSVPLGSCHMMSSTSPVNLDRTFWGCTMGITAAEINDHKRPIIRYLADDGKICFGINLNLCNILTNPSQSKGVLCNTTLIPNGTCPWALLPISRDTKSFTGPMICSVANNCEFYRCLEKKLKCGAAGYPIGYGEKYCEIFSHNEQSFDEIARNWSRETRMCLQRKLELIANSEPNVKTCDDLRSIAFRSHPNCYTQKGSSICSFEMLGSIVQVIKLTGFQMTQEYWTQFGSVIKICSDEWYAKFKREFINKGNNIKKYFLFLNWHDELFLESKSNMIQLNLLPVLLALLILSMGC